MGQERYRNGFQVTLHEDLLEKPKEWRKPQKIFVNSMSDLFHEKVPSRFIQQVFSTIEDCSHHSFQILTKRSRRLSVEAPNLPWPSNLWMGVSVENSRVLSRIDHLRSVNAKVRFLSLEPLLGPLENLRLDGIDWVIVGGESGPGAREMKEKWVQSILEQCQRAGVPFFFKQWGGPKKGRYGRTLNGRVYDEYPSLEVHSPVAA